MEALVVLTSCHTVQRAFTITGLAFAKESHRHNHSCTRRECYAIIELTATVSSRIHIIIALSLMHSQQCITQPGAGFLKCWLCWRKPPCIELAKASGGWGGLCQWFHVTVYWSCFHHTLGKSVYLRFMEPFQQQTSNSRSDAVQCSGGIEGPISISSVSVTVSQIDAEISRIGLFFSALLQHGRMVSSLRWLYWGPGCLIQSGELLTVCSFCFVICLRRKLFCYNWIS